MDTQKTTTPKTDEAIVTTDEPITDPADPYTATYLEDNNTTNKVPVPQQLALLAAILLLLLGTTVTTRVTDHFKDVAEATPESTPYSQPREASTPQIAPEPTIKPFSEVSITAKSAYVWDVQTQRVLYKKEPNKQVPLASVTKLMTALVAHELLSENADIAITDQAIRQYGNSGLLQDETFERTTLSDLVLMSSSNDGAFALAQAAGSILSPDEGATAFVHAMNIRAKELSLHDTYFKNPTGLDISEEEGGAYGSAKDMAFLMEYIATHQPQLLEATTQEQSRVYSEDGIYHDAENTNYNIDEIPGLIGSKTGYTDLAGGNLVIAFNAGLNRPIVVSVLGSTRQERFTDVTELVHEAQRHVAQQ